MRHLKWISALLVLVVTVAQAEVTIVNASYDPTRELYQDYNAAFAKHWKETKNEDVTIKQSHGGSGKQARAIVDGLEADVASLSVSFDIDVIAKAGLTSADWRSKFPDDSSPYSSTVVFLVRKGNPKGVKDWDDLIKPGTGLLAPNPKTGGGARWIYLAAWGQALRKNGGGEAKAREFTQKFYANMLAMDQAMRGSTTKFVRQGIGDVLVGWENEILQVINEGKDKDEYQIVIPSDTITIDVPIALVDKVVDKHGNREVAEAYVKWLWSKEGQEIIAKRFNRPRDPEIAKKYGAVFPAVKQFTLKEVFGNWNDVMKKHFVDGAIFDSFSQK